MKILILILLISLLFSFTANADTLIPIGFKGKWGYVNESGNIIIKPQFDNAWDFAEGLAPISINGKEGFINQKGQKVIDTKFDRVYNFSEDLAIVVLNNKYGYIDKKGSITIPIQYDEALNFRNGFSLVKVNDKWGYIDKTGKFVFEPKFDKADSFGEDGLTSAKAGDTWHIINNNGSTVLQSKEELSTCNEGLLLYESDKKWGCTDKQGKIIIPAKFSGGIHFKKGVAVVPENNKWAVIDAKGNYIANPIFEDIMDYNDGLASFKMNGKHGYMDIKGHIIIQPTLSYVTDFGEGITPVALTDEDWFATEWTYIDKTGKPVNRRKFTYRALMDAIAAPNSVIGENFKFNGRESYSYSSGRFIGVSNDKIGYWNRVGNPIVLLEKKCGEEYLVNGGGKIIWPVGFKPSKNTCSDSIKTNEVKNGKPNSAADYKLFRAKLKEGDNTHCGLVIEVKNKVVKVQTMIGEHWFKIGQILPEGAADCKFINNVYQEP